MTTAYNDAFQAMVKPLLKDKECDIDIARWNEMMERTVPNEVQYRKALRRLLSVAPSLYHVVEYKDTNLFSDTRVSETIRSTLSADDWRLLSSVNAIVRSSLSMEPLRVPSREEIAENIRTHKQTKRQPDSTSVPQAFRASFNSMCNAVGFEEDFDAVDDKQLCDRWSAMVTQDMIERCTCHTATDASAWTFFTHTTDAEKLVKVLSSDNDHSVWSLVNSLNNCSKISTHIPGNVMTKIEDMASKLANDIQTGNMKMDQLDLASIGEQVLSGCSSDELSLLTNNIGGLLPVLNNLQTEMKTDMPRA